MEDGMNHSNLTKWLFRCKIHSQAQPFIKRDFKNSPHLKLYITPILTPTKLGPVTLATNSLWLVVLYGTLLVLPRAVPQAEEPLLLCPAGHPHCPALHHQDRFCLVPHQDCPHSTQLPTSEHICKHQ